MKIINWDIVAHPLNWVTLFLMVFIFGVALHFVLSHYEMLRVGGSLHATSNTTGRGPSSFASAA